MILEEPFVGIDQLFLEVELADHATARTGLIVYAKYDLTHHIRGVFCGVIFLLIVEADQRRYVRVIKERRVGRASILIIGLEFETTS